MNDHKNLSKEQLIIEIEVLRAKVSELEGIQTQKKLTETEEKYSEIFENMLDGFAYHQILTDKKGTPVDYVFLEMNSGFEKLTGLKRKEIIGKTAREVLPGIENDPTDWIGKYGKVALGGGDIHFESYAEPLKQWFSINAYSPQKGYFVTFFEDITDRKIMEASLIESNAFNETLLNTSPDIIYVYDIIEQKNIYSNEGIQKVLNYSTDQIKKMGNELIASLMHKDDFETYLNQTLPRYQKAKDGELIEHEYRMKDVKGTWHWLHSRESVFYRMPDGTPKQIFGIIRDITEQKQAEDSLRERTNFLNRIIDSSALSTWISDEAGTAIRVNPACLAFFGATEEEVVGKYNLFKDRVIEEQGFMPLIRRVFENGEVANIVVDYNFSAVGHIQIASGKHKIVHSIFTPVFDDRGKLTNVIIQSIDLTDIKKTEYDLKISEERLNLAMKASRDGLFDWNLKSDEIFYSSGWKRLLGYQDHELPNDATVWEKLTLREDLEQSRKMQHELINKQRDRVVLELRMKHKEGHWLDMLARAEAVFDASGDAVRIVGTLVDITERKQIMEAIRVSEDKFRTLANLAPAGIFLTDNEGNCTYANPCWLEMSGLSLEETLGKGWVNGLHADDREKIETSWYQSHEARITWELEYRFQTPKGKITWVKGMANPFYDANGNLKGYIGINLDITERKQYEEELKNYQEKLTDLVKERTRELELKNEELDKAMKVFVGREVVIRELQKKLRAFEG